jgi:hypothetical protein
MRERLNEAIGAGQAGGLHSAVVVHGGQTVLEHYGRGEDFSWGTPLGTVDFDARTQHDLRSVTKAWRPCCTGSRSATVSCPRRPRRCWRASRSTPTWPPTPSAPANP